MSIQMQIVRTHPAPVVPVTVAAPTDELSVLVTAETRTTCELEVFRGPVRRHRQNVTLTPGVHAFTLNHGNAGSSQRLVCRVLVNGRSVAEAVVLLATGTDNQGRLSEQERPCGEGTRIVYQQVFDRLLASSRQTE